MWHSNKEIQDLRHTNSAWDYMEADRMQKENDNYFANRGNSEGGSLFSYFIIAFSVFMILFSNQVADYINEVVRHEPLHVLTQPIFVAVFVVLGFWFSVARWVALILLLPLLPTLVSMMYALSLNMEGFLLGKSYLVPSLAEVSNSIHLLGYGTEMKDSINHVGFAQPIIEKESYGTLVKWFGMLNCAILVIISKYLFRYFYEILAELNKEGNKPPRYSYWADDDNFLTYFVTLLAMVVTYYVCIPWLSLPTIQNLPYKLDLVVAWSVYLFPILGYKLARQNMDILDRAKLNKWITRYYMLFFIAIAYVSGEDTGLFAFIADDFDFSKITIPLEIQLVKTLSLLPALFVLYYSLIMNKEEKKEPETKAVEKVDNDKSID